MLPEFRNEPLTDFSRPEYRSAMEEALKKIKSELGQKYPVVVGGEKIFTDDTFNSINPGRISEIVGTFSKGDKEMALRAVETAAIAFETWRFVAPDERARYLLKAASIIRRRKFEFSAVMVYEVSKSWVEADADVAETIDFLEFYAREMMRLGAPQPVISYPGEENELYYIPLGVCAVIPPWNFPFAIMAGMTTAAIVAGNTVVLKPASTAPFIAWKFFEVMEEVSLPTGVLNFLPGSGGAIGDTIVDHPKTRLIAFTGSKEIGLRIQERAAKLNPGQIWIKRTILEMGGKDFILVDEDADVEAAAEGIVFSAFGFQGQKCSACSRAIIHEKVYDAVLEKIVARTKTLKVGHPEEYGVTMGAVIDATAQKSIMEYILSGKKDGRCVAGGGSAGVVPTVPADGFYVEPTVIADVPPKAKIACEEIFGPVLAVIKCQDFDEGVAIANGTEYGLTGALYSRSRAHLERGRAELHCGNLYLNRKCTGALVGVQPFGGFNMSGTDSKAGGRDYLLLFTQAKSVTERF